MLKICIRPKPDNFDSSIQIPGTNWLQNHPNATPSSYPKYWRRCLPQLHEAYKGICCYYGMYIEQALGGGTVDHFRPKSTHRALVYEWSNFRYSSSKANSRKSDYLDVIDPVYLPSARTFLLDFGTLKVYYNDKIYSPKIKNLLDSTIRHLRLNSPDLLRTRQNHYTAYLKGEITAKGLEARSPFVYYEAFHQGLL